MPYLNNAAVTVEKPVSFKDAPEATPGEAALSLAGLFRTRADNILFTDSGTSAIRAAVKSFIKPGDHVISTDGEHRAVLDALAEACSAGSRVTFIPLNEYGVLRYDLIEKAIEPDTRAIICCHGSALTGNVTDLERVGAIARKHGLMVIADGTQTAGAVPVNLEELQTDVFCFSGHKKLMGPAGTGGICLGDGFAADHGISEGIRCPSRQKLGQLKASVDFILEKGIYGVSIFPHRLAKRFFESVRSMKDVTVYGDFGTNTRVPTVSLNIRGFTSDEIKEHMRKNHIAISSGDCSCPRLMEPMGIGKEGVARFSFGYFNTRMDVNDAIWALMELQGLDDLYYLA